MNWSYLKSVLKSLWNETQHFFSPDTIVGKLVIGIATFYAPVYLYAVSIFGLIIIDVITGVWASIKKGEKFKSKLLRRGLLEKVVLYGMLFTGTIIMGQVLQSVFKTQTHYIAWLFTVLISVYEVSSIIENAIIIKPELSFLNKIKKMLQKKADEELKSK